MAIIAHLDMDAFFAAVEERDNPQWAGLPIVVGSDPKNGQGRGVVSTANYAARKYGIRSALPITKAWQFAKAAEARGELKTIFVQGFWRSYSSASKRIMQIIQNKLSNTPPLFLPLGKGEIKEGVGFQQTGVDEAYFDLSFTESFQAAKQICENIKQEIKTKERLTCSIGLGPNKLIAKIASDFKKPDGLTIVRPEHAEEFLEPLPVRTIPGVGPKMEAALHQHNIKTVKDLKQYTAAELDTLLGSRHPVASKASFTGPSHGESLYRKARGVGSTTFSPEEPPKSISEQQTFWKDTRDPLLLTEKLHDIASNLIQYLQKESHITIYRTVTVTVRFSDFETHTFSHTLKKPTGSLDILKIESLRLLLPFLDHRKNPHHKLIRLIGLRIEKLG